jgi:2-polyprenyl-3-methyl-5-hydroxy-6-metoxy-1,4-benzoquinol methylase
VNGDRVEFVSEEWGPSSVTHSDLSILAELTGRTEDECMKRLAGHRLTDTARAWKAVNPTTPAEIRKFYSETDEYLWELLAWNGSEAYELYRRRLDRLRELWPPDSHPAALDYGAGVGTAALVLAQAGYEVTLADVPGLTLDFARRRLDRAGETATVIEILEDCPRLPPDRWNVLVSFDVIEHLVDPAGVAVQLVRSLEVGGGAAIVASFTHDERWPHHLGAGYSRFADHRWEFFLQCLGLKHLGENVYRRLPPGQALVRKAQYYLWNATGIRVERVPR